MFWFLIDQKPQLNTCHVVEMVTKIFDFRCDIATGLGALSHPYVGFWELLKYTYGKRFTSYGSLDNVTFRLLPGLYRPVPRKVFFFFLSDPSAAKRTALWLYSLGAFSRVIRIS